MTSLVPAMQSPGVVRHVEQRSHLIVGFGPLVVYTWADRHSIAEIERFGELLAQTADRLGQVAVLVDLVSPSPEASPDDKARLKLADIMRSRANKHRGIAYLIGGTGFAPAIGRAAITALNMMARPPYPVRVFSEQRAAVRWLGERLGWPSSVGDTLAPQLATEVARWSARR